jgi:hypothetical protein
VTGVQTCALPILLKTKEGVVVLTNKQRFIIVVCLSLLLFGLMVFEVVRTESMKLNFMEKCLNDTKRFCYCTPGDGGSLFQIFEADK